MDMNCECDSGESFQSSHFVCMCDSCLMGSPSQPLISTACSLCQRLILSDNGTGDIDDRICSDCKFLLMEDLDSPDVRLRRTPASRRRHHSSESAESIFSEQFSEMIIRSRQNRSRSVFSDPENRSLSSYTTRGSSRRSSVLSDTESDGFGSLYWDSESNVSIRRYNNSSSAIGGDSDASVNDQNFGNFSGGESDLESDADIDPRDTGFYEWESDEIGDGSSLEEEDIDESTLQSSMTGVHRVVLSRSNGNNIFVNSSRQLFPQPLRGLESLQLQSGGLSNILVDSVTLNRVGDYLEARGFEYLLQHLAESERLRKVAHPAAASFLSTMPCITINEDNLNDMACAICKDLFTVGTTVNQLPCFHLYHPSCILPWLSTRNTCPLCRYELPTEEKDYEDRKRREGSLYGSPEIEANDAAVLVAGEEMVTQDDRPSMSRNRWLLLAAPIAGLAGISLMFWFGGNRSVIRTSPRDTVPFRRNNNNRRWWPFF